MATQRTTRQIIQLTDTTTGDTMSTVTANTAKATTKTTRKSPPTPDPAFAPNKDFAFDPDKNTEATNWTTEPLNKEQDFDEAMKTLAPQEQMPPKVIRFRKSMQGVTVALKQHTNLCKSRQRQELCPQMCRHKALFPRPFWCRELSPCDGDL